ncbi:unnamed protein product [Rhodiola kirilowii]
MGSQTPLANDRSRTYWTPTMERYFIDLMLDHMHRGNRSGHTFNKQAWTEMLTVFNARFESQYDKDVLKSRYTNLWKQFNDVKVLLGQNGFSWDETRQMVVADDYTWDAYIKAHPDARFYRTKAVLNFNDLCLIYGYTSADGRYSLSSHDVDIDDEATGANMAEGVASVTPSSNERSRTDWTPDMDRFFIELMLDHTGRGNKIDNTFNKHAWTDMLASFNSKFGPQHGKRVLRHRYKKLLKYFSEASVILQQDGFFWDEERQIITAAGDVWGAFIKTHPFARSYRTRTLPNYKDLSLIFGDLISAENCSNSIKEKGVEEDVLGTKSGEEGQAHNNVERSRTYWTPPMDRYLIDLLLEQVHKGNKLGQTFITKAWINMITLFNARFGTSHDKDVLKNRFKHFKRQFNEIKLLLQQTGFSWDDTREMVVAEDDIWDAYTKEHPDARAYRVKTIPGYHKLLIIFGQENYARAYNRLACNLDSNFFSDQLTGGEKNDHCSRTDVSDLNWTEEVNSYFISLLIEQVHVGNNDNNSNGTLWTSMALLLNQRFGLNLDSSMLEARYVLMMKQHQEITELLNHEGFAWDETQNIIVGENTAWEDYSKEHPNVTMYRNRMLGDYPSLCLIFGSGNSYVGGFNFNNLEIEIDDSALGVELDGICTSLEPREVNVYKKRPASTPLRKASPRKARKNNNDTKQGAPLGIMEAGAPTITNSQPQQQLPIESAINALQAIPDIDDELLLDACDLMEDETKAKTFLALDAGLRKKWLLRKLRPS